MIGRLLLVRFFWLGLFSLALIGSSLAQSAEKKLPPITSETDKGFLTDVQPQGRTPSDLAVDQVKLVSQAAATEHVQGTLEEAATLLPRVIDQLKEKVGKAGLSPAGPPLTVYTSIDDNNFVADIMVPLAAEAPAGAAGDLKFARTPSGKALRIVHRGPLETIEDTYNELETFVEDKNIDLIEPTIEIERYLTNPAITAPTDMVTEVYVPVK